MRRIGDLIPDAARALGLEDELRLARAMADVRGDRRGARAGGRRRVPGLRLDGFASIVEADAPIVAQELRLRAAELLAAFAAAPGGVGVARPAGPRPPARSPRIIRDTCQPSRGDVPIEPGIERARRSRSARRAVRAPPDTRGPHGRPTPAEARPRRRARPPRPTRPTRSSWSSRPSAPSRARRATSTCSSRRGRARATRSRRRASPPRRSATSTTTTNRPGSGSASRRRSRPPTSGSPTRPIGSACKSPDGNGPIGVGVAVVRGNEMYVATVGPAEAYLIRQARLSTLPDPHRERGLPSSDLEPDVWRGEVSVGDSLVLISPNVMAKLGADELKDAMLTLHPQSAMEHLHHRFVAADGSRQRRRDRVRGDRGRRDVARPARSSRSSRPSRWPARPDRSPIPLADNVAGGGARRDRGGRQRPGRRRRRVRPARRPRSRTSCPGASRPTGGSPRSRPAARPSAGRRSRPSRSSSWSAASAWRCTRSAARRRTAAISSVNAGQDGARHGPGRTSPRCPGPGIDLVDDDPNEALELLTEAYEQLDAGRGRQGQRRASSPRSAPRSWPVSTGCTAWSRSRVDAAVHVQPAEGADPIDLRGARPRPRRRAVRPRRGDAAGLPDRPQAPRRATLVARTGRRPAAARSPRRGSWRSAVATC